MIRVGLSIITPCYNSEKTIKDTLLSVERQGIAELEHIIIDGGSTDGTMGIISEYHDRVPYDVQIISEPDNGIYDAMNKGIRMATGDLVGIINSDDWYEDDALAVIRAAYTGDEHEIIYGMIRIYDRPDGSDDDQIRSVEFYHHDFLLDRMINHPGCFVTAACYRDYGLFDLKYKSSADYAWMKHAFDEGVLFTPVYDVLANVRAGGMSGSNLGFRETLKLQHEWGRISTGYYLAYDLKSRIGDVIHKIRGRR
ncbi:MAG: glycosyltransferase [Lachnospiraceae bacterium]|nr:glycosyltransferase [Lachnospiraceae bacterium]